MALSYYVGNLPSRGHKKEKAHREALEKMKNNNVTKKLSGIRKSLKNENVSYGELAELGNHKKHIIKSGDVRLAEAAGIPEHEFNRRRK